MNKILLWGGKSKARIAAGMLADKGQNVDFIFDPFLERPDFETAAAFGKDASALKKFIEEATHFIVCIGGEHGLARTKISKFLEDKFALKPLELVSSHALIEKDCLHGAGFQAMPGSVVHKFCRMGDYVIVNTNATVDHECVLGDGVHIMGGAALAGCITVGSFSSIGTNSTILPNLTIGDNVIIGAGAVVTKNVPSNKVVVGVPGRILRDTHPHVDLSLLEQCL